MHARALAAAIIFASAAIADAQEHPMGCGTRAVAILVDPELVGSIRRSLDRWENDLCTAGYDTVEHVDGFADPPAVRAHLAGLWQVPGHTLAGAVLIGGLPHAYQWVTVPGGTPPAEEVISFQYYADLDGTFSRSAGYTSLHASSFDEHGGNLDSEIWIGVLPVYKGDRQQTVEAIERYFDKNHAFRTRRLTRPEVFLQVNELHHPTTLAEQEQFLEGLRSGEDAWTPLSAAPDALIYIDGPPGGSSVWGGYSDLRQGASDLMVANAHGTFLNSGYLNMTSVEYHPVRTLSFWGSACSIGNLDQPDNFLTSVLYSPTSEVLFAQGSTNDSGGLGTNVNGFYGHNIAEALTSGASYGDAVRSHVNAPLLAPWSSSREFHVANTVLLGDPTLIRTNDWRAQPPYPLDCRTRPPGTVCVGFDDGYRWLVRDAIRGWDRRVEGGVTVQVALGTSGACYEHQLGTGSVRIVEATVAGAAVVMRPGDLAPVLRPPVRPVDRIRRVP